MSTWTDADIIAEINRLRGVGLTLERIAVALTDLGIHAPYRSSVWTVNVVRHLLRCNDAALPKRTVIHVRPPMRHVRQCETCRNEFEISAKHPGQRYCNYFCQPSRIAERRVREVPS